jgi:hypothetical protein
MTETPAKPEPQGIIAIMTSPGGDVIATAADFNRSGYGGYKLWEAQRSRAQQAVKWKAVRAYCSTVMADALSSYLLEQISDQLCQKGHKITVRAIGYSEEIANEVARR